MFKSKLDLLLILLISILIFIIFRNWFGFSILSSGDWSYLFPKSIEMLQPMAVWDYNNVGSGGNKLISFWIEPYYSLSVKMAQFISWVIYERMFWFFPFIFISFISSYKLSRKISDIGAFSIITPLIYMTNTYVLIIAGGGQVGVLMAYSLAPLVLLKFINVLYGKNSYLFNTVILSLVMAILLMFDLRIFYTVFAMQFIFLTVYLLSGVNKEINMRFLLRVIITPVLITLGLHLYWILPILIGRISPAASLGEDFTGIAALRFLSFGKFENTLALFHPNWPENIFGKTGFLNQTFLFLPIMAFLSILFIKKDKTRPLLVSILLTGLAGIFLSKGSNEPYGNIYEFLFNNFPGFIMFRDSTKWYVLVCLAYSILIPYSLFSIGIALKSYKLKIKLVNFILIFVFIIYWTFLIKDIFVLQKGTFTGHPIDSEYELFAKKISGDYSFYRILWVPKRQRLGFVSSIHPAVNYNEIDKNFDYKAFFQNPKLINYLAVLSIKYVVIPLDPDSEIFLKDREYNDGIRINIEKDVQNSKLSRLKEFTRLSVYEVTNPKNQFYLTKNGRIDILKATQTRYELLISNYSSDNTLVFTDNFDPFWKTGDNGKTITSQKYKNNQNSFNMEKTGIYKVTVEYAIQKWVNAGSICSLILLLSLLLLIFRLKHKTFNPPG